VPERMIKPEDAQTSVSGFLRIPEGSAKGKGIDLRAAAIASEASRSSRRRQEIRRSNRERAKLEASRAMLGRWEREALEIADRLGREKQWELDTTGLPTKPDGFRAERTVLKNEAAVRATSRRLNEALLRASGDEMQKGRYFAAATWCGKRIAVEGGKATTKRCRYANCLPCSQWRSVRLANNYGEQIEEFQKAFMVTLTVPNVAPADLNNRLDEIKRVLEKIGKGAAYHLKKKHGISTRRLGSLEVTGNAERGDLHPHIHFIVDGWDIAKYLVDEWLKAFPDATNAAQDITRADENSLRELLKYVAKPTGEKGEILPLEMLDAIYSAMRGRRTIVRSGLTAAPDEDAEGEIEDSMEADEVTAENQVPDGVYDWDDEAVDWVDIDTGELLTGWAPEKPDLKKWESIERAAKAAMQRQTRSGQTRAGAAPPWSAEEKAK